MEALGIKKSVPSSLQPEMFSFEQHNIQLYGILNQTDILNIADHILSKVIYIH